MVPIITEKTLNPRRCIEETILYFNPDISDKDLLDLRESIYLKVYRNTPSYNGATAYFRDYRLYAPRKGK